MYRAAVPPKKASPARVAIKYLLVKLVRSFWNFVTALLRKNMKNTAINVTDNTIPSGTFSVEKYLKTSVIFSDTYPQ